MRVKPLSKLTLRDRLSRLDHLQAKKLLGPRAASMMPKGGIIDIDIGSQVRFEDDEFRVTFPDPAGKFDPVTVTIALHPGYRDRLSISCSLPGEEGDLFLAATMALILEEKLSLGLAAEPDYLDQPWELLPEEELERRALSEREARAREEEFKIKTADKTTPWTDYTVTSALSGKSYRVALRGLARGDSYCTCPDFRKNRLGTCKHVIRTQSWVTKKFAKKELEKRWKPKRIEIFARYDGDRRLSVQHPSRLSGSAAALLAPWAGRDTARKEDFVLLYELVRDLERAGEDVVVFPDAEEILTRELHRIRMASIIAEIRAHPAEHPLRRGLLRTELLPYQLDGIAFAAGAGRAVLADEMGLGKTIQGVGVAEFLARHSGISRVLIVCPASLKSQWRLEILRFCERDLQIVAGKQAERADQYRSGAFFTICNYEQVLRDYLHIERAGWDLIILDEAQRIKNWEAKTTSVIKSLRSPFALVLTGTPLENRLDDLYSVVEFIDDRRLGPAYRFIHGHRVADEGGKVLGYKNLDALRERLRPVLLRRTRVSVSLDLPPRTTEIVRIQPTEEQMDLHRAHMQTVTAITSKKFLTEMDLLRLQKALLAARMSADSTFLCDKQPPGFSSKLERLAELLAMLIAEPERKIIIFSEWTTMLNLIEPLLRDLKAGFVRLDGKVPQKKRQQLVAEFQGNPACRVFLTTNAGSTGLNLQAADTVINVDLPWNPALLEQRIARAHRMGQKRKVHAYLLVSEGTIEDNLLATLSAKHELAAAVLDPDSDLAEVRLSSGIEELKRRLELLLGAKPEADPDVTAHQRAEAETALLSREKRVRVEEATGQLVATAFNLLGAMMPASADPAPEAVAAARAALGHSVTTDESGRPKLTLTLPDAAALESLTQALAALMSAAAPIAGPPQES